MRITYARTAQVAGCPDAVLDRISRDVSSSCEGDGIVLVDIDNLKEYVEKHDGDDSPDIDFLSEALHKIEEDDRHEAPTGEVILVG